MVDPAININGGMEMVEIKTFLGHQEKDTQSIALLKEFYAGKAFNSVTGSLDMDAISRIFVEHPTWNVCLGFPDGGTYNGIAEVFGSFYANFLKRFALFYGVPEVFIDGGDVVTVLGHYIITFNEGGPVTHSRFSHTFKIAPDGRIEGVWQVADSAVIWEGLKAE